MFWNRSIKAKILSALLLLSGLTFSAVAIMAFFNTQHLGQYTLNTISQLGNSAVTDSKIALRTQTQKELLALVESQAFAIEIQLEKILADVKMITGMSSALLISHPSENPKMLSHVVKKKPDDPEGYSAYLLAPGVKLENVKSELAVLSRMHRLFRLIKTNARHLKLVFIGTESGVLIKHPWTDSPAGYDPRKRGWYINAVKDGGISWSSPYIAASYNALVVSCSIPILDERKRVMGVAAVDVSVDSLANDFISQQARRRGSAFLINGKGDLVAGNVFGKTGAKDNQEIRWDEEVELDNLLENPIPAVQKLGVSMTAAKESGIYRYNIEGREYFVAYAPISATGGCVGINLSVGDIDASIIQIEKRILSETDSNRHYVEEYIKQRFLFYAMLVLVFLIIIIYSGFVLSRKITRPIVALDKGAREIGAGNLDFNFDLHTGDEIEALAKTFNDMTDDLKLHIKNLRETVAAKEKIESDLQVGREIQASMLPRIFPAFPERTEFDIYATMKPAHEVAGDFYDFFFVDEHHLFFCIGDVSGKGVPAALFMVITKTLIKDDALRGFAPNEILAHVNNALEPGNDACMFATAFCGILDTRTGKVTYSNAGHNPPLVKTSGKNYEYLSVPKGFVIGPMPMEHDTWEIGEFTMSSGDVLFLYSDGVTEAMNPDRELFSTARLKNDLNTIPDYGVSQTAQHINAAIKQHAEPEPQSDDIAIMVIKFEPPTSGHREKSSSPTIAVE